MPSQDLLHSVVSSMSQGAAGSPTVAMIEAAPYHHGFHRRYVNMEVTPVGGGNVRLNSAEATTDNSPFELRGLRLPARRATSPFGAWGLVLSLSLGLCALSLAAEAPAASPTKKGALLFSDDFERAEIGPRWETSQRAFAIVGGALKGGQVRSEHGAVAGVEVPSFKDAVIEFRFRFEGAASINAVIDDRAYTNAHAGHICRVTINPRLIRLGDDREGGMRNDIMEMRKDPKRKAEADRLLVGRTATFPMQIETNQWHLLAMEMTGDEMRVSLNGRPVGRLKSPGIAHPTKSRFHFTIGGKDALIDDVKVWAVAPVTDK